MVTLPGPHIMMRLLQTNRAQKPLSTSRVAAGTSPEELAGVVLTKTALASQPKSAAEKRKTSDFPVGGLQLLNAKRHAPAAQPQVPPVVQAAGPAANSLVSGVGQMPKPGPLLPYPSLAQALTAKQGAKASTHTLTTHPPPVASSHHWQR